MKMIKNISELKKGDTVIARDCRASTLYGLKSISGDIFNIEPEKENFTIKCIETNSIEEINLKDGAIFLI